MKLRTSATLLLTMGSLLLVTSCVKKYTCQCQIKYSGSPGLPDSTVNEYEIVDKKKNAESTCQKQSYEKNNNGIKVTETCKLY